MLFRISPDEQSRCLQTTSEIPPLALEIQEFTDPFDIQPEIDETNQVEEKSASTLIWILAALIFGAVANCCRQEDEGREFPTTQRENFTKERSTRSSRVREVKRDLFWRRTLQEVHDPLFK